MFMLKAIIRNMRKQRKNRTTSWMKHLLQHRDNFCAPKHYLSETVAIM